MSYPTVWRWKARSLGPRTVLYVIRLRAGLYIYVHEDGLMKAIFTESWSPGNSRAWERLL